MLLSIEAGEGRTNRGNSAYGRVHASGCRDLVDELELGEVESLAGIPAAIEDATGWDATADPEFYIGHRAPCVKLPAKPAQG